MQQHIDTIRAAVSTGGIKKNELAEEAGLHRNSLADIWLEAWDPRISTLQKLLDAIDRIKARRG